MKTIRFPITQYKNQTFFTASRLMVLAGVVLLFASLGGEFGILFAVGLFLAISGVVLLQTVTMFGKNYKIVGEFLINDRQLVLKKKTELVFDWKDVKYLDFKYDGFDGEVFPHPFAKRLSKGGYKNKMILATRERDYAFTVFLKNVYQKRVSIRFLKEYSAKDYPVFIKVPTGGEK